MWNKVVTNLIFGRQKYCRLCFSEVDDDDLGFHDEVLLNLNTGKISSMLLYIFGGKFTSNMRVEDMFCSNCVTLVKTSYNFMKMCKDKSECLENILDSLNESLKNTEGLKSSKSVLIHIDSTDFSYMQFYQYRKSVRNLSATTKTGPCQYLIANKNKDKEIKPIKLKRSLDRPRKYPQLIIPDKPEKEDTSCTCTTMSEKHDNSHASTANDQPCTENEENENNNSSNGTSDTQVENNLEKRHCNLKAVIQKAVSSRSRKHVLKLAKYNKKKVTAPENPTAPTEPQEDITINNGLAIVKDSYIARRANILGKKKFKCPDCGKEFRHKQNLINHMEKLCQCKCKYCGMRFSCSKATLIHMRAEHLEPWVECDICFAKFKVLKSMHSHRKKHFDPNSRIYIPNIFPSDTIEIIE